MRTCIPAAKPRGQSGEVRFASPAPQTGPVSAIEAPRLIDRWDLFKMVKILREELGLAKRDLAVLSAHLTVLPKGPVDTRKPILSFMSVKNLLERSDDMEERTFRRGETGLEEAGLIRRIRSANARRYALKTADGQVEDAFGVDLAPLFLRVQEFEQRIETVEAERAAWRNLCSVIRANLAQAVRAARDAAVTLQDEISDRAAEIIRILRRKSTTIQELRGIDVEVQALQGSIPGRSSVGPDAAEEAPDTAVKSERMQQCAPPDLPDITAGDGGQTVRHIESPRKKYTDCPERLLRLEIETAWAMSPHVQALYPEVPRNGRSLESSLMRFSDFVGIDWRMTQRAISTFGLGGAITALDELAKRAVSLRNPSGYLAKMISSYQSGRAIASGRVQPAEVPA